MEVIIAPDSRLRVKTRPVKKINENYKKVIRQMIKLTKTFVEPEGVGLASTQVGLDEQFFVAKLDDGSFKAFFNPKILKYTKRLKTQFEGCLSIPNYWGEVKRATGVTVSYTDINGKEVNEKLTGFIAWVFQHETDHLQGKLFMDMVLEQKGRLFRVKGKDRAGNEVYEEIPL